MCDKKSGKVLRSDMFALRGKGSEKVFKEIKSVDSRTLVTPSLLKAWKERFKIE